MLIDWFTVAAQIVNFLILALLLRKFLYRPVTRAIAQRKQKISDELAESEAIRQDALQTKALYEKKYREFEDERSSLLAKAISEIEEEKAWRLKEVKEETEEQRNKLIRTFRDQEKAIYNQISQRAQEEVFGIARKVLSDLASQELENFIVDEFVKRIQNPDPIELQKLKHTLNADESNTIGVRSAFRIDSSAQKTITKSLGRILDLDRIAPRFEIKPELVCGIEIQINHYKLEWHVTGYLEDLETKDAS
jgi:F-type H+-transporting ATPase subunit b